MYSLATALPFVVCLTWTIILGLKYRQNDRGRRALAFFGAVASLLYFCHYLHFNGLETRFSEGLYFFCSLSVYPLYSVYILCLTGKKAPRGVNFLWFVPALVVFVLSLIGDIREHQGFQLAEQVLFALVSLSATFAAELHLLRFRARVNNYYANPEEKRLGPTAVLLILLFATAVASFVVNILGRGHFMAMDRLIIPATLFSTLLFAIFYVGEHTELPADDVRTEGKTEETAKDSADESAREALMEKIHQQMEQQQLFRSKGLTVAELAEAVGSNRTYVSACINHLAGQSFSDFVNKWRIEYAQQLMKSDGHLTITEVADKAGFTDRTTFYRSFKKMAGMGPTEWLQVNNTR